MKINVAKIVYDYDGTPAWIQENTRPGEPVRVREMTMRDAMVQALNADASDNPDAWDQRKRIATLCDKLWESDIIDLDDISWDTVLTAAKKLRLPLLGLRVVQEIETQRFAETEPLPAGDDSKAE
jgi:hypothetical protein